MKGLILSGGRGTRLRPITHTGPKQLVPVANKPVLQYAIEDLREAGVTEIGIVLGNLGREAIQEYFGDGSEFGVEITYIVQGNPLGLAHAAGCARDFIGDESFVMYLGDNMLKQGIHELVEGFEKNDHASGIALQRVEKPEQFGVPELNDDGEIVHLVEKPDDPPSDLALIGVYVFSPLVFDVIERLNPSWRGELEITDAIQMLIDDGHSIDSHIVEGWWKDTGKPEDILEANRLVLEDNPGQTNGTIEESAETTGHIDLHETAIIKEGATVRGPVSIDSDVTIGSGTYIGPYTSIGAETEIKGAHIENSVVVGKSKITASEKIVDSLIGRGAMVQDTDGLLPEGRRLIIGENSNVRL